MTNSPWVDGPSGGTPITAARLNDMEARIAAAGGGIPAGATMVLATEDQALADAHPQYTWVILDPLVATSPSIFPSDRVTEFVAADLAAVNNTAVTSLPNRVAGGAALVSGDGIAGHTSSPTYRTDLNTRAVISFDGVDDFMGADTGILAQPSTTILIVRFLTVGSGKTLVGTRISGANRNVMSQRASSTKWNCYAGTNLAHTANTDTALHMFAVVFNGASTVIYLDGVAVTGTAGTEGRNGVRVGAADTAAATLPTTTTSFTNMALGEMAVIPRAMTTSELDTVRTAAKARWTDLP